MANIYDLDDRRKQHELDTAAPPDALCPECDLAELLADLRDGRYERVELVHLGSPCAVVMIVRR